MANPPLPSSQQPDPGEPGRIIVLLILIATTALWLQHHLGFEFAKLGWVVALGAVWGLVGKLADWIGESPSVAKLGAALKTLFQRPVRALARPVPLGLLGAGLAVVMATVSSVIVQGETSAERTTVSLAPQGETTSRTDTLGPERPVLRYRWLLTNPFGRLYQVSAAGYLPTTITVHPLVGKQVVLGKDLFPSPSVLFRPFEEGVAALHDQAVFRVTRVNGGQAETLAIDSGHVASFLLGRLKRVPESLIDMWSLELTAMSAPDAVRAKMLVLWNNPRHLEVPRELAPHDCLRAEILAGNKVKARGQVTLAAEPLVDILLHDVTNDSTEVLPC